MTRDILKRIEQRLAAVRLSESAAAKAAGLSADAIRNIRRAVNAGDESKGISTNTLFALAPVLETTVSWLVEEAGPEQVPIRDAKEIRRTIAKIDKLRSGDISALLTMIDGFQRANAAEQPEPGLPGDQSELANPRREASPSR